MSANVDVDFLPQLYCCAVDDEGWALYRESKWFKKFGAQDDIDGIRYGHGTCSLLSPCIRGRVDLARRHTSKLSTLSCNLF